MFGKNVRRIHRLVSGWRGVAAGDGGREQMRRRRFSLSLRMWSPVAPPLCGLLLLLAAIPPVSAAGAARAVATETEWVAEMAAAARIPIAARRDEAHAVSLHYTLWRGAEGGLAVTGTLENTFVWDLDDVNLELTVTAVADGVERFRGTARELILPRHEGMPFVFRLPVLASGAYMFTFAYEYACPDDDGDDGFPSAGPFGVTDFSWFEHEITIPAR
ncbi:MAG: hypothetical protein JW781_11120 [Deltaproteobacteria bacterium]|nr:hypothetical protein [Candidatus Anaeroferrophillacea bacterium]